MTLILACMRRDWRISLTHGPAVVIDLAAVLVAAVVFYYLAVFVGRGGAYFSFAVAGVAMLRMHAGVPRVLQRSIGRVGDGTLEILLSGGHRAAAVLLAEAAFELVRGLALGSLLVLLATTVFHAEVQVTPAGLAAVTLGLLGAFAVLLALAVALLALLMVLREAGAVASLSGVLLPVLGGVYFPLSLLPQPWHAAAAVLPFHVPVDVIRRGLFDGALTGGDVLRLVLATGGSLTIACLLAAPAVAHARRAGRLALE